MSARQKLLYYIIKMSVRQKWFSYVTFALLDMLRPHRLVKLDPGQNDGIETCQQVCYIFVEVGNAGRQNVEIKIVDIAYLKC
jgi:hypothetical protein